MTTYRISVTTVEKFRRYMTEASSFDTEEELIKTIKGIFEGNAKTMTGGAYHKLLEGEFTEIKSKHLMGKYYSADSFWFSEGQASPALQYRRDHPRMFHEIPIQKIYDLGKYRIKLSGRADGIEGIFLRDGKTKFRKIDFQEYMDSYQWRYYLDMFNLRHFFYDVFEVKGFTELPAAAPYIMPDVIFLDPESLLCERYTGMEEDCQRLLLEFMDYIDNRNFYHLLKQENETVIL